MSSNGRFRSLHGLFRALAAIVAGIAVTLALPEPRTHAAASSFTVRVGYPQLNGGQAPLWVLPEARVDRQYGVDLKPVYIPGGVRLTQSLISGSIDAAMTGGAAVNAMLSGADLTYIAIPVPTFAFSLYARPEIKDVPDLRGKVMAVITKGASSDHASIALLRQYRMTQQDLKVLYFSRQEDALAALKQGIVSAAVHSAPTTLMARRLGFKELVNIGSLKIPYPFSGLAIKRSVVQQDQNLVRAFVKAYVAGIKIAVEQPELAKRAMGRYLATRDQEVIEEAYRSFAPLFPRVPYATDEVIRAALSVTDHPKAASANPRDFYDNRFLSELENSGFIKELYGSR
ncbi:MAG TPA: ABC transporter substrate-binding protein [candidate division Zixibacteria bacterium]|nr:ABC transporter substrate-binding protein [candidate division Zixibacteria bacterium]